MNSDPVCIERAFASDGWAGFSNTAAPAGGTGHSDDVRRPDAMLAGTAARPHTLNLHAV